MKPLVLRSLIIVVLTGCAALFIYAMPTRKRTLSRADLLSYISDPKNGLIRTDSLSDVNYALSYRPGGLVRMQDTSQRDSLATQSYYYFILKSSFYGNDLLASAKVPYDYIKVLNNLTFNLRQYAFAVYDKKDTIPLKESVYARNYGVIRSSNALLLFESREEFKTLDIYVSDFVFENGQRAKFRFYNTDIKNCPDVKL